MDSYSLHAQIVHVSLGFLLQSQGSHMHHIYIFYLHMQIVDAFLGLLSPLQGSHMHHMHISFLRVQIVCVLRCPLSVTR